MHEVRLADRRAVGLGLRRRPHTRHYLGPRPADPLDAPGRRGALGLVHPAAQRARQLGQGRLGIGGDAERDRVAPADLPGIVVELDHGEPARERGALRVQEPREHIGADDQQHVAPLERLADGARRRKEPAPPQRVIARDVRAPVHGLAVHARSHQLGQRRQLGDGLRARDPIARDDDRSPGAGEELSGARDGGGIRPRLRGDRRRSGARVLDRRPHEVHR